jgi:hypothetical protein
MNRIRQFIELRRLDQLLGHVRNQHMRKG